MAQLQGGDVGARLVGDEGGVAVALGVEDLEPGTEMGRPSYDQPCALRSGGEVDQTGELGDLGVLARFALGVDRLAPCPIAAGTRSPREPWLSAHGRSRS
jgi:hypothetical protein